MITSYAYGSVITSYSIHYTKLYDRPHTVILQYFEGRHPDHRVASRLGYDACFVAGLRRAPVEGEPHRPSKIVYALSYREEPVQPTFVVDITGP